jgi:hypothetical protein
VGVGVTLRVWAGGMNFEHALIYFFFQLIRGINVLSERSISPTNCLQRSNSSRSSILVSESESGKGQ